MRSRCAIHHRLRRLSTVFMVHPGQFVAIVGATGSGKSSLARLLIGLYPPSSGAVLIDGMNLSDANLSAIRQQIGVVTQHTDLFSQRRFARTSRCPIHQLLCQTLRRPQKWHRYTTTSWRCRCDMRRRSRIVGSLFRVDSVSACRLARALLRRPGLLLLDEATSALDCKSSRVCKSSLLG